MIVRASRLVQRSGATLLEVMVAMAILGTAYVALMRTQSGSIRLSTYGKQLGVATFLARAKLEEWEEKLNQEGFPDMDDEESDNFDDLGYPSFRWKLEIKKVELPLAAAFEHLVSSLGGGEEGGGGIAEMLGNLGGSKDLGRLSGMLQGLQGGAGGLRGATALLNPDMLKGQVDMLGKMLEESIREVRVTVSWAEGEEGDRVVLTTHLVRVPQAPSAAGAMPGAQPAGLPQPGQPATGKTSPLPTKKGS